VGVPICRYLLTKTDLDWRKALKNWRLKYDNLVIAKDRIYKNGNWYEYTKPWMEITSRINIDGTSGTQVPRDSIPLEVLQNGLELALTELDRPLSKLTNSLDENFSANKLVVSLNEKKRLLRVCEISLFWLSIVPLILAIINPIWVLSFGPLVEWSPAGLELARAASK
jgi:hypothetical protein